MNEKIEIRHKTFFLHLIVFGQGRGNSPNPVKKTFAGNPVFGRGLGCFLPSLSGTLEISV